MSRKKIIRDKAFSDAFRSFAHRYPPYQIWSDFCHLAMCAIANSASALQPKEAVEAREKSYMNTAKRYDNDELNLMAELLAATTEALTENPRQDFLGETYMGLELGNERTGQYFTPYHVSEVMARMNMIDAPRFIERKRYITICDPCVGSGGMFIAAFNTALDMEINPQTQILFTGVDIDRTVLNMAYIQCSLLGMCGRFTHGNSLTLEHHETLATPMLYLNWWRFRRSEEEPQAPAAPEDSEPNQLVIQGPEQRPAVKPEQLSLF
jgi:type I restriction-modification system DNA methylase subunit